MGLTKDLNSCSIHELREIARYVGVKSPSNKKKEELIKAISKIKNNEVEPEFNNSKVGRPPMKNLHPNAFVPYSLQPPPQSIYVLNSPDTFVYGISSYDEKGSFEVAGVLELCNYGFGIVRTSYSTEEVIYISDALISKHKLKIGDHILGRAKLSENKETKIMISITKSYNYELGYIRKWFRDFDVVDRKDTLNLSYLDKIQVGSNNFIKCSSKAEQNDVADKLYKDLNQNNIDAVLINFNALNKSQRELSNLIDISFSDKEETKARAVMLAIEHAKRLVENNKDVVLIFSGLSEYLRVLDNLNKNAVGGTVLIQSVDKLKEMTAVARAFKDSSLSTIFVDSVSVPERYAEVIIYDIMVNMHKVVEL